MSAQGAEAFPHGLLALDERLIVGSNRAVHVDEHFEYRRLSGRLKALKGDYINAI